jgi:hypothetical protein
MLQERLLLGVSSVACYEVHDALYFVRFGPLGLAGFVASVLLFVPVGEHGVDAVEEGDAEVQEGKAGIGAGNACRAEDNTKRRVSIVTAGLLAASSSQTLRFSLLTSGHHLEVGGYFPGLNVRDSTVVLDLLGVEETDYFGHNRVEIFGFYCLGDAEVAHFREFLTEDTCEKR